MTKKQEKEYKAEIIRLRKECFNCEKAQKRQTILSKIYEIFHFIVSLCGTVLTVLFTVTMIYIALK